MFTWILIAIAIAFIFGVIKVENIKDFVKKHEPQARDLCNKLKIIIEKKAAEIKKNSETKSTSSSTITTNKDKNTNSDGTQE